jgi:hypothetical protein
VRVRARGRVRVRPLLYPREVAVEPGDGVLGDDLWTGLGLGLGLGLGVGLGLGSAMTCGPGWAAAWSDGLQLVAAWVRVRAACAGGVW